MPLDRTQPRTQLGVLQESGIKSALSEVGRAKQSGGAAELDLAGRILRAKVANASDIPAGNATFEQGKRTLVSLGVTVSDSDGEQNAEEQRDLEPRSAKKAAAAKLESEFKPLNFPHGMEPFLAVIKGARQRLEEVRAAKGMAGTELDRIKARFIFSSPDSPALVAERRRVAERGVPAAKAKSETGVRVNKMMRIDQE